MQIYTLDRPYIGREKEDHVKVAEEIEADLLRGTDLEKAMRGSQRDYRVKGPESDGVGVEGWI